MPRVLIATDSPAVAADVQSVLPREQYESTTADDGRSVVTLAKTHAPDLVILDFQIGSMGGMAICLDLRLEASGGRMPEIPTLLLLDRRADVFLARRAGAQGWLIKPTDPIRLRKAIKALLDGTRYEDTSFMPQPTTV